MRLLYALHDFLPRHPAGSEIYAFELARELSRRHDVFVLAAEYDPSTAHGTLRWRRYQGLAVIELVNNWEFARFEETYSSPRINAQLQHVLEATRPDVLHVHNLLNLSFDLPRLARERGIASVATLHDYTLVCASGGQRVHTAEGHVCEVIDPDRCSRCFPQSALGSQLAAGRVTRKPGGRIAAKTAAIVRRLAPAAATAAAGHLGRAAFDPGDITRRLAYARHVFDAIDLFVAPSRALGAEFVALGLDPQRLQVSDYGFVHSLSKPRPERDEPNTPLRIGFVGTLVWHKGVHILLESLAGLTGRFEVHLHGDTSVFPVYSSRLRRMAQRLPVTFDGRFDHDDVAIVYDSLDVLVVPSLWPENSPLVIHEAFMHGVPVVGARMGGIPELVTDGINGLLYDAFSPESLRASLKRLMDDPTLLARFAAKLPAIKDIRDDAREWEARYAQVLRPMTR